VFIYHDYRITNRNEAACRAKKYFSKKKERLIFTIPDFKEKLLGKM
jgi:hypothetical protein